MNETPNPQQARKMHRVALFLIGAAIVGVLGFISFWIIVAVALVRYIFHG